MNEYPMSSYSNTVEYGLRKTYCSVARPTDQSVNDTTDTAIDFTTSATIDEDSDGMFSTGATSQLTVKRAGFYILSGYVVFATDADGVRTTWITVNDNVVTRLRTPAMSVLCYHTVTTVDQLAVGDVIKLYVRHAAGAALNITADSHTPRLVAAML